MIGKVSARQGELFIPGSLEGYIPEDHILRRVDGVLDLSWLEEEVRECYCEENGRPSIAPEAALRLMLAGFFHGIVHDRKLMREAQVNLAIRWFAGYSLGDQLPDHSSLTRIRQRWGAARFKRIFRRTVEACMAHGLVNAETVHVDATLIRADVSWQSVTRGHVRRVVEENSEEGSAEEEGGPGSRGPKEPKKRSRTDPDATLATGGAGQPAEPGYKQHTVVDDASRVVLDAEVTTGERNEGQQLLEQLGRVQFLTGEPVRMVTADAGYGHGTNYEALEEQGTEAVIRPQRESGRKSRGVPLSRFKYDPRHQRVRCPGGKVLLPVRRTDGGTWYSASSSDCGGCPLRARCVPPSGKYRTVLIVHGYDALIRARRQRRRWDGRWRRAYARHWAMVEGVHGEAKSQHGLGRAARRGLANVRIQAYLTAAVINLKRLVKHLAAPPLGAASCAHEVHTGSLVRCMARLWRPLHAALTMPLICARLVPQLRSLTPLANQ